MDYNKNFTFLIDMSSRMILAYIPRLLFEWGVWGLIHSNIHSKKKFTFYDSLFTTENYKRHTSYTMFIYVICQIVFRLLHLRVDWHYILDGGACNGGGVSSAWSHFYLEQAALFQTEYWCNWKIPVLMLLILTITTFVQVVQLNANQLR